MDKNRECVIAGNWKMNILPSEVASFAKKLGGGRRGVTAVVCPTFVCLPAATEAFARLGVAVGSQDVSAHVGGAYTGEVSAVQLRDTGVTYAIVGHSERRQHHGETDSDVNAKAHAALEVGLRPIICVGESIDARKRGETLRVLREATEFALSGIGDGAENIIIAYEPVWAIGTGVSASPDDAEAACAAIRGVVSEKLGIDAAAAIPILYGGSVSADNARELLQKPDIDGALIGGKSLDPASFAEIIKIAVSVKSEANA